MTYDINAAVQRNTSQVLGAYEVLGRHKARERSLREDRARRAFEGLDRTLGAFGAFQEQAAAEREAQQLSDAYAAGMATGDPKSVWQAVASIPTRTRMGSTMKVDLSTEALKFSNARQEEEHRRYLRERMREADDLAKKRRAVWDETMDLETEEVVGYSDPATRKSYPAGAVAPIDLEDDFLGPNLDRTPITKRRDATFDEVVEYAARRGGMTSEEVLDYRKQRIDLEKAREQNQTKIDLEEEKSRRTAEQKRADAERMAARDALRFAQAEKMFDKRATLQKELAKDANAVAVEKNRLTGLMVEIAHGKLDMTQDAFNLKRWVEMNKLELQASEQGRQLARTVAERLQADLVSKRAALVQYQKMSGVDLDDTEDETQASLMASIAAREKAVQDALRDLQAIETPEITEPPAPGTKTEKKADTEKSTSELQAELESLIGK